MTWMRSLNTFLTDILDHVRTSDVDFALGFARQRLLYQVQLY